MSITQETLAQLQLIRTPQIGPVAWRRLIAQTGSAQNAIAQLPDICRQYQRKVLQPAAPSVIEEELEHLHRHNGRLLIWGTPDYPTLLSHVPDAPPVLSALGAGPLSDKTLSIVGTRNASAAAMRFTQSLAAELSQQGYGIASGLARGVDTAAHQGALQHPAGTIAVVAGGVDHLYPPENAKLRESILEHGLILSEQPWGTQPTARFFPRRNRIVAGLSRAVIVTEASRRSGSLITARYAGDYGREVFAVPGSPADPRAAGCNHLIKQGAILLEQTSDILDTLPLESFIPRPPKLYTGEPDLQDLFTEEYTASSKDTYTPENAPPTDTSLAEHLFTLLGSTPVDTDELIRQCIHAGLGNETEVLLSLTDLELDGKLTRTATGAVVRS